MFVFFALSLLIAAPLADGGRTAADSAPAPESAPPIDGLGKRMLDPLRERTLAPEALLGALGLHGTETVADVGAGPGFFALRFARRLPRGKVIATDVQPAYLAYLRAAASQAGLTNVETRVVQPRETGLAPGSADLVFLCQVDHYLPDRRSAFQALYEALRPQGRLVIVNSERFREADRAALAAAGLTSVKEDSAAPGYVRFVVSRLPPSVR